MYVRQIPQQQQVLIKAHFSLFHYRISINQINTLFYVTILLSYLAMRSTPYITRLTFNNNNKTMHMNFIPHMLKSITLLQEHYYLL